MRNGAVILGDLIHSGRHDAATVNRAMHSLQDSAASLAPLVGDTHFTRFRGDGWQLVTARPEMALRLALAMMARLESETGPATRVAIGIGQIDDLAGGALGAASGSAFLRSGQMLDGMPARRRLVLAGAPAAAAAWADALLQLIEFVTQGWSPYQAQAVSMALAPGWEVQADLAERLGVTRQAMQLRLKGAGYPALSAAVAAFEAFGWEAAHG